MIESFLQIMLLVVLSFLGWIGGYLLARFAFALSSREQWSVGLALNFLLSMALTNLAAHWLSLLWSYFTASITILMAGMIAWRRSREKEAGDRMTVTGFVPLLFLIALTWLFFSINRGLAIFDENYNLPIISLMAAGDLPPHFPFDPGQPLAYHYGLHLMSALLVRYAALSPWSAFDLVRAFTHALMLVLAALWFFRQSGQFWLSIVGSAIVYFGGNTQWLLLFAPQVWIRKLSALIPLTNTAITTGKDLYAVMVSPWKIDGLGAVILPFAFVGGIFKSQNLALTSSGAGLALTVFVLLLLESSHWRFSQAFIVSLVLAALALLGEYLFALIAIGSALVALISFLQQRSTCPLKRLLSLWLPASILALSAGGVLTVFTHKSLISLSSNAVGASLGVRGFEWQWPPSLATLYFGRLSLFQADQLVLALLLLGPALFLFPLSISQLKKRVNFLQFFQDGLVIGAGLCFLITLFIAYADSVGGITRLTDASLLVVLILSLPSIWNLWKTHSHAVQVLIALALVVMCWGGVTIFSLQLPAVARPQTTYYLDHLDVLFYDRYWNRLPEEALVFDPNPARAVVVFGRSVGTIATDYNQWLPEWLQLEEGADPNQIAQSGFSYAYLDKRFWERLDMQATSMWQGGCAELIEEQVADLDFRRLYDLRACR